MVVLLPSKTCWGNPLLHPCLIRSQDLEDSTEGKMVELEWLYYTAKNLVKASRI